MVGAARGQKDQWKSLMETKVLKRTMGRLEKIPGQQGDPGRGELNGQVMPRRHLQGMEGQSEDFAGMDYNCGNKGTYI